MGNNVKRIWTVVCLILVLQGAGVHAEDSTVAGSQVMKVDPDAPAGGESKAGATDALNMAALASTAEEGTKKFTGSPITLKMKDADIHEVMRLISEASGFNIVLSPSVKGAVTVSLENVPWDQALEVVMTTMGLAADRNDSVLRVMPRDVLLRQKQEEIDNARLSAQTAPRITRVFPLSYSDPSKLQSLLKDYLSSFGERSAGIPAKVLVDENTQSLIVQDTMDGVDRVKKILRLLDVQTPQLLIETKVVDATESFT
ncbi:MAG: hypothetical protein EBX52_11935, partial [Proteobacteria bacterium]|nr:hypothetical protein [Pseudomonadota bacterium]